MEEILDFSSLDSARDRKKRRFMRIVVPIACVSLLMAALLGIVFLNYSSNRKDALALSDDLLRSLDSQIATEVRTFLSPAAEMVSILDSTLRRPGLIADKRAAGEPLAMQMLGTIPQLAIFSLGDPDGNYLMLKKTADQSILTKLIQRDNGNVQVTWIRRDSSGRETGREHSSADTYDPRVRPWYTGAVKMSSGVFWTDVYVFFTDRKPGITASRAIRNEAGDLLGVVGLDIELTSLSRFLGSLEIGHSGKAMIVDDSGRLVAYPDMGRMLTQKGETLITKRLNEMGDPVLERVHNRFLIERQGRREVVVQGKKYINTVSSLFSATGKHWSVLIVVPAEDFVGFVSHNYQKALIMSVAVLIMATALAGLLIWQGLRADKNAGLLLSRRQAMERQSKAFSDMAAKPAIFDPADGEALKELVRLTADAVGVRRVSVWLWTETRRQLVCCDCYDRESDGHTSAIVLLKEELPQLFAAIPDTGALEITDSANNPRTAELHRVYLHPLGCNSLLSTTIADQQRCQGVLWLEQEGKVRQWEPETISFAQAVAGLLALRFSAEQGQPVCAPVWVDNVRNGLSETEPAAAQAVRNHAANDYLARPAGNAGPDMRKATLLELRNRSFRKQMNSHGESAAIGADIFESVTVLVLQFTDPMILAHRLAGEDSPTTIDRLIQQMEERASQAGIAYMKFMSDQLVCAAGFQEQEGSDHARVLAAFALEIQNVCNAMLKSAGRGVDFRIGMDTGAVIGSMVGREHQSYNLWGEAVRTAGSMAESGATGEIHVSESTYRLLERRFLFKVRGRYYLPGVGELATYSLTGQL